MGAASRVPFRKTGRRYQVCRYIQSVGARRPGSEPRSRRLRGERRPRMIAAIRLLKHAMAVEHLGDGEGEQR